MSWKNEPEFAILRSEFLDSLESRKVLLKELLNELEKADEMGTLAQVLEWAERYRFVVHKLAGVARSFEFIDLADLTEAEDDIWGESNSQVDRELLKVSLTKMIQCIKKTQKNGF